MDERYITDIKEEGRGGGWRKKRVKIRTRGERSSRRLIIITIIRRNN